MGNVSKKIVLLGDEKVGKSAIVHRIVYNCFNENYHRTIGLDFTSKNVGKTKFYFWDTSGVKRYRDITDSYFKGTSVFILVLSSMQTIDEAIKSYQERLDAINNNKPENQYTVQVVFNKMQGHENSSFEAIQRDLQDLEHPIVTVNAKAGTGFEDLQKRLLEITAFDPVKAELPPSSLQKASVQSTAYPASYTRMWKKAAPFSQVYANTALQIKAILDDYTKNNSSIWRFVCGHWNRHHCKAVQTISENITDMSNPQEILLRLKAIANKNPNGSLARRIGFIEDQVYWTRQLSVR